MVSPYRERTSIFCSGLAICFRRHLPITYITLMLLSCTPGATSVAKHPSQAIVPIGTTLWPKVGDTVDWRFGPASPESGLVVYDIVIAPPPFGVLVSGIGPQVNAAGKILGNQYQSGKIVVTARDVLACREQTKATLELSMKNAAGSGQKEGSIPAIDCDDVKKPASAFDRSQAFMWWLSDAAEAMDLAATTKALALEASCLSGQTCPNTGWTAHHASLMSTYSNRLAAAKLSQQMTPLTSDRDSLTGPLDGGECLAFASFAACHAQAPRCAWNLGGCIERRFFP